MEIAIYAEGGGDGPQQKADLRTGLDGLLKSAKSKAQSKRIRWKLIPCGGRSETYNAFVNALATRPDRINVLLVDSEGPVATLTKDILADAHKDVTYLTARDQWNLTVVDPSRVHLMAQCMEAWIVADPEALEKFYGQYFAKSALPTRKNLEEEAKQDIYDKLAKATGDQRIIKKTYGKIKHASQLLPQIDPAKVAIRCPRFGVFMRWLEQIIDTDAA